MLRLCFFCILFLCILSSCHKKTEEKKSYPPRPVKMAQVEALGIIQKQFVGEVQSTEFSILAFKVSGTIDRLNISEGQKVKKGQLLATIDPTDYRLQYETAETNYQTAKAIYGRTERLHSSNATALQNLEITQADYIRANSAMDIAKLTLEYTRLLAPFSGIIEKKYAENYEEIVVGQPIAKLINPDSIEVAFTLPETSVQLLHLPKTIYVEFDSQKGKLFTSDIKESIYASNGYGIPITLRITDKAFSPYRQNVFPGFSCKIIFQLDNDISNSFIIPASALFTEDGIDYVWLIDPSTRIAHRQKVDVFRYKDRILVKSGLNKDDYIVTAGVHALHEGQQVSIL